MKNKDIDALKAYLIYLNNNNFKTKEANKKLEKTNEI